jgi:Helix-turn-helix domain
MTDTHLNQRELARRLKLSPRTLEGWRWRGAGPRFVKAGGRVLYRLEDVEAFEAEQLRQRTPRRRRSKTSAIDGKDGRDG